ncbi:zinc finger protein 282 [Zootoca vivipara]|uniref:zinc finger protein 282 n=1 Tax=Zootoca vivipara TaxID=8524 RepID=UPI00293BF203|nr:zinc finger protein 282 [Zootoca vivipara]
MAEWLPPAQTSRWSSEVPAAPVMDATFPKEAQLQTATISLWTVVGAVQAVERTVEAQALRLLSLEQRSKTAEKRFGDCEKAVAELGSQLDSRWSALETLLQEYGQLQKRLETMEDLLKNGSSEGRAQEPPSDSKAETAPSISRTDIISWIKQEEELCTKEGNGKDQDGALCQSTCNYYTVSGLDTLPSDGEGANPCESLQGGNLEAETHKGSTSDNTGSPASRSDAVTWVKQEEPPTGRDGGNGPQSACNANDRAQPHPEEGQGQEDPANPPLLLFFPGGSVAPIFNGAIGESCPLPGLRGARSGRHPGSPSARGTPEAAMERPHRCPDCGKTFSLLLSLQMHQMNHQMKRKQYECSFCGTAFSCPSELLRHRMIHTGERPYRCSVCGKGFVRKQHLVPHLRLHTGERPYHCAECGKDFICKHHLQEHQRTHTGERPYACAQCGKRFRRKKSLKDHWRVHSAEEQQQGLAGSARVPEGTEVDVRVEH